MTVPEGHLTVGLLGDVVVRAGDLREGGLGVRWYHGDLGELLSRLCLASRSVAAAEDASHLGLVLVPLLLDTLIRL